MLWERWDVNRNCNVVGPSAKWWADTHYKALYSQGELQLQVIILSVHHYEGDTLHAVSLFSQLNLIHYYKMLIISTLQNEESCNFLILCFLSQPHLTFTDGLSIHGQMKSVQVCTCQDSPKMGFKDGYRCIFKTQLVEGILLECTFYTVEGFLLKVRPSLVPCPIVSLSLTG